MEAVNLNPMIAPISGENVVMNSSSGSSTVIYFVVVLIVLILLVAVGYFAMKSSKQETTVTGVTVAGEGVVFTEKEVASEELKRQKELAYIAYHTERGNPPELNEDGSLVSDIISGDTPEPEPETINITDGGSRVENYIVMPDTIDIDYEYQTYAYNPAETNINGSAMTFDKQTNKCPDGTLDCLYYTRVEDGKVKSITDKDGVELIEKFSNDLWSGKLKLLETPDSVEMMKAYELNDKRQLMRDGKVLKPGVDLTVGQYLMIFSIMYRAVSTVQPNIVYNFPAKKVSAKTQVSIEPLPTIVVPPTDAVVEKVEFATPTKTEETPTSSLNDLKTNVKLVTPVITKAKAKAKAKATPPPPPPPPPPPTLGSIRDRIKF